MRHASFTDRQRVRYLAAELFTKGLSNAEIARYLGIARQSVSKWHTLWLEQGEAGLRVGKPGPDRRLSQEQWEELQQALLQSPKTHGYETELWTLERIADLIEKRTGIHYHPSYVWYLLKSSGWSCQKPERRSRQRDEEAIARWKVDHWPLIKKGRKNKEPG